ncbi:P1 family peptidase [uncultured Cohaesibacter sp.]|uniref:P1 family peptidase n=1 Tax=uncultured Cohaesibacter sp. TaxID=1002546 RepID=UPI00292D5367|nr:P1 family peptidase [uncultured Cohaesibacter sp.]
MTQKKARDFGIQIGSLPCGPSNSLSDIDGLSFGHVTLSDGAVQTGVSVIHPVPNSPFENKCAAACHVFNGFGKSVGLMQVEELGQLETPIVLTNTLSVGTASSALVRYMLAGHEAIGETTGTVNPVVMECNDGGLSDIRGLHISEQHVLEVLGMHEKAFEQGAIGAGTGMVCYSLKGGIGSASRQVSYGKRSFTLAAATLCNMGRLPDLLVGGRAVGAEIEALRKSSLAHEVDKGSIIMLVATDAPLSSRQLKRICVRAGTGLARTGSHFGSGSGDIALAFSTATRLPHESPDNPVMTVDVLHESAMDQLFRATVEAVEEAILNALFASRTTRGKKGRIRTSLADWWPKL